MARAILWFERGSVIEAEAELKTALAEGEDTAEIRAMLALCLLRCGLKDQAAREIKLALGNDPECAFAYFAKSFVEGAELQFLEIPFLGRSPLDGAKARACLKSIRQAVELEPDGVRFLLRLAELQRVLFSRWQECLAAADRALALEPDHLGAAIERATALSHLRRKAEARETLARCLAANPAAAGAHAGVGWALLHNGDHVRAAAFFDEALRLDAGCDWAQAGALEAAKHQYRSYRMIAAVKDWFIHQPIVLRAVYGLAAIIPACMVLVAILKAFDPMVRSRVGNEGTALVMGPILFAILLPVMFHDYIFLWLVRRKRAALTSTGVAMRNAASGHLWLLIPGLLGGLLAAFMQRRSPEILGVLLGLLPGANAMWIVRKEFAGSASRKWWVTYAVTLIVAGPLVALLFGDVFRGHDRMWILIALLVPIVPPCLAVEWHKRQKLQRQHDEALSAALRPPHS